MRWRLPLFTLWCLVSSPSYVRSQNFPGEPPCATPCLSSAIIAAGCDLTDEACQCGPGQASIGARVAGCLFSACPQTYIAEVISVGLQLCEGFSLSKNLSSTASTTSLLQGRSSSTITPSSTPAPSSTMSTVLGIGPLTVTVVSSATVTYATAPISTSGVASNISSAPTNASHSNTLSSGAIAGISVGSAAAVFGVGLLLWIVLLRRRRMRANATWLDPKPSTVGRVELDGNGKQHELHGEDLIRELSTSIDLTLSPTK